MSDFPNIERLREALGMVEGRIVDEIEDFWHYENIESPLADAARFLLDLADQGGELWMETKCKHNLLNAHDYLWGVVGRVDCDGGSRVRVWPKEDR